MQGGFSKNSKKGEILYSEPKVLMKEEFREPKTSHIEIPFIRI